MMWRSNIAARLREDSGFTIIEVLVAALILTLASAALFGVLAAGARNGARAKATQIALDRAQQEMEKLHSLDYEELALRTAPLHSTSPLNPNNRVNSTAGTFALKRQPQEQFVPMVVDLEKGMVRPGPLKFEDGEVKGHLYRYIVWRNDPSCGEELCPGPRDYKQLIVAVKLDSTDSESRERNYIEVQSAALDPEVVGAPIKGGSGGTGGTGGGGTEGGGTGGGSGESAGTGTAITAQQFFLTDTPCSASGVTLREEITGDHLLHNTLGTCASGAHTGTTLGAPDALLLGAPPDPDPEDDTNPALYNYSNDGYLETNPDTGKGVQIKRDDTSGCHFDPTGTVHPEAQVHRWVTDPFAANFKMSGKVTLEFYTRTLNDALYHGTLCVYLFKRHKIDESKEENSFLANQATGLPYWTYTPQGNGFWPRSAWTKVRLTMEFTPTEIFAKDRLGVALSVDPGNTDAEAIPIMYDHPNFPTRIEVNTTTPTEGG